MRKPVIFLAAIPAELQNKIFNLSYQELLAKIPDRSVDVLLTDPPYNVDIAGESWDSGFDLRAWLNSVLPKITDDGIVMVFNTLANVQRVLLPTVERFTDKYHDFSILDVVEWGKTNPRMNIDISRQYEFLLVAYNNYEQSKRSFPEDFEPFYTNELWETSKNLDFYTPVNINHPTSKPVRLLEDLIRKFTRIDDIILDTTSGTGAIPVAAWSTHRRFLASELDADYALPSQERLKQLEQTVPRSVFLTDWMAADD